MIIQDALGEGPEAVKRCTSIFYDSGTRREQSKKVYLSELALLIYNQYLCEKPNNRTCRQPTDSIVDNEAVFFHGGYSIYKHISRPIKGFLGTQPFFWMLVDFADLRLIIQMSIRIDRLR